MSFKMIIHVLLFYVEGVTIVQLAPCGIFHKHNKIINMKNIFSMNERYAYAYERAGTIGFRCVSVQEMSERDLCFFIKSLIFLKLKNH